MDRIEQRHRFFGLVRLQLPDQVQFDVVPFAQGRPLALRFLDPVFGEYSLAGGDQGLDRLGGVGLADRDQGDFGPVTPGDAAGLDQAFLDRTEQGGCAFHARRYSEAMRVRQTCPALDSDRLPWLW